MATLSALQISVQVSKDYQAGLNKVKSDVDAVAKSVGSSVSRAQASILSICAAVRALVFMGSFLQALVIWAECPRPVTA